jgi:hypothetical protein
LTVHVKDREATAVDISASGVYFTVSPDCELGSKVEFELVLPEELVGSPPARVRCLARVVRVERHRSDQRLGIAAAILTYHWVRPTRDGV